MSVSSQHTRNTKAESTYYAEYSPQRKERSQRSKEKKLIA